MTLVSILTGSTQFFLGLLALLAVSTTIGNFVSLHWLRRDLGRLEYEVFSLGETINRPGQPKKGRKQRRRKQRAARPPRTGKGRRKGDVEHSLID